MEGLTSQMAVSRYYGQDHGMPIFGSGVEELAHAIVLLIFAMTRI